MSDFARKLVAWQAAHGRHDLPWQASRDAYRVWLSEIMLQQTQVATVIPYYRRFLERFPDLASLAAAELGEVLALWSGLGYYARARNLHACARALMSSHGGRFPRDPVEIAALPGIGRSTAAAIAVFAYGARAAILDGNVKRVLCRAFAIEGFPGQAKVEAGLWSLAESLLPEGRVDRYIQAQMDLGATVCTRGRPGCERCPLREDCVARREDRVAELPRPRPRKLRPLRRVRLLLLAEGDRVLLQRRPPAGVWGGLLAPPELPEDASDPAAWAQRELGLASEWVASLPRLRHGFSHFELEIEPLLLRVQTHRPAIREGAGEWLAPAGIAAAALPAPIRRLLLTPQLQREFRSPATDHAGADTAG